MDIYFLGTGSAVPTPERDNAAIYVECMGSGLLIDCPGSPLSKLRKLNIEPSAIKGVFITHMHTDHVYGLPSLLHSLKPFGIAPEIYVSEHSLDKVLDLLKIFGLDKITTVRQADKSLELLFHTELFPTRHTAGSSGIKILCGEKTVIYTSDTGPMHNAGDIFKDADYLIHDCYATASLADKIPELDIMHTSALRLGMIAEEAGVKNLVPIHFSGKHEFLESELVTEINKNYSGNIIIPRDMDRIEI